MLHSSIEFGTESSRVLVQYMYVYTCTPNVRIAYIQCRVWGHRQPKNYRSAAVGYIKYMCMFCVHTHVPHNGNVLQGTRFCIFHE